MPRNGNLGNEFILSVVIRWFGSCFVTPPSRAFGKRGPAGCRQPLDARLGHCLLLNVRIMQRRRHCRCPVIVISAATQYSTSAVLGFEARLTCNHSPSHLMSNRRPCKPFLSPRLILAILAVVGNLCPRMRPWPPCSNLQLACHQWSPMLAPKTRTPFPCCRRVGSPLPWPATLLKAFETLLPFDNGAFGHSSVGSHLFHSRCSDAEPVEREQDTRKLRSWTVQNRVCEDIFRPTNSPLHLPPPPPPSSPSYPSNSS